MSNSTSTKEGSERQERGYERELEYKLAIVYGMRLVQLVRHHRDADQGIPEHKRSECYDDRYQIQEIFVLHAHLDIINYL